MKSDQQITAGEVSLGIELGSTRIKAVLIGAEKTPIAVGSHQWRSRFVAGHWTYPISEVWSGIQAAYLDLTNQVQDEYGVPITKLGALGISGMMHGYLPLDDSGEPLVELRTWQDTTTGTAARELSELFGVNIPLRWSIAHLHQAILAGEEHVGQIAQLTTLAGYVHWRLSGQRVLGIGDASGMFPTSAERKDYVAELLESYENLVAAHKYPWKLHDILPRVLYAGQEAGRLTDDGARLLDPTGRLLPGSLLAPPEGDAGTGMVATNSVAPLSANVSAGTSIFAMVVLERPLDTAHEELDIVATPAGDDVVMVHCNNGAVDLQDWVQLFGQVARALGADPDTESLFGCLYEQALAGDLDAGGLVAFNYRAGEPTTGLSEGRPLFLRLPESELNLPNFMRAHLFAALATLRIGFETLRAEGVQVAELFAHGGLFRTPGVAQRLLSAALAVPVTVGQSASEGGAWGMALLAEFARLGGGNLGDWLRDEVFAAQASRTILAAGEEIAGFDTYLERYRACLAVEQAAVTALRD